MSQAYRQRTGNPLLVRDGIGKGRPPTHVLPPEGHAYGLVQLPDPEGVREVLHSWAVHIPARRPGPEPQDLLKLNKWAAHSGVTDAKKLKEWRVDHLVKFVRSGSVGAIPKVIPSDVFPSFAYGQRSRPSTPISRVIGGLYAAEQEELLDAGYQKLMSEREKGTTSSGRLVVRMTKSAKQQVSNSREQRAALEGTSQVSELFKMAKFKKVPSRLGLNIPDVPSGLLAEFALPEAPRRRSRPSSAVESAASSSVMPRLNLPALPRASSTPCL